jgi:C4-dicarboxylate transporter DctM subunit
LTTVGACTVFGAISGSSVATVAAVGRLMYPSLKERYGERFGAGVIASTGAIDILIPPSIVMILYGASAEQSVAVLFIAGILPGLLMAAFQGAYVYYYAVKNKVDDGGDPFRWRHLLEVTRSGIWALLAPIVILGGIYGGIPSISENARISARNPAISQAWASMSLRSYHLRKPSLRTPSTMSTVPPYARQIRGKPRKLT